MKKILYLIIMGALLTTSLQSLINPVKLSLAEEATRKHGVVITEIMATASSNLEWIEIRNLSEEAINLEGWKFFENSTNHGLTVFQGNATLRSDEIAIIANKADELKMASPTLDITIFDSSWSSLKEEGEEIGLRNNNGDFTELFTYTQNTENSLQRIDNLSNDYSINNWINAQHTIGKENLTSELILQKENTTDEIPATPDIMITVTPEIPKLTIIDIPKPATPDVDTDQEKISQQMAKKQPTGFPDAVITIQSGVMQAYNKVTINLDGTNSSDPNKQKLTYFWDFDDGFIYENKNPPSHSYKEIGTYLVTLRVTNESGLFDEATLPIKVLKEEASAPQASDSEPTKIQKNKNPISSANEDTEPKSSTSEEAKPNTSYPTLLLNEIFPNPAGRDDGQEWVEIYNPNDFPVNTKNYILDDYTDSGSTTMKLKEVEIQPKGYYLAYDPTIILNNSNEEIQLFDPSGNLLDKIFFSQSFEGQSYARIKNEWLWTTFPTPNFENEIISEELEISEKEEKDSKFQNGDLSSEIYISEILPNPIGEDALSEWVELYNAGSLDINLGNWKLDDNENGSKPYTISDKIIIKAKSYLIIERIESRLSLDNRQDSVRLLNFEEEIQDEISYEKAKENLSYAKISIINDNKMEIEWTWTPIITKGGENPKLYKLRGEVKEKNSDTVLIQAKTLKLKEDNELTEITLSPGNLVELTYDDNNEIREYTLIKQKTIQRPEEKSKLITWIIKAALIMAGIGLYAYSKRKSCNNM